MTKIFIFAQFNSSFSSFPSSTLLNTLQLEEFIFLHIYLNFLLKANINKIGRKLIIFENEYLPFHSIFFSQLLIEFNLLNFFKKKILSWFF